MGSHKDSSYTKPETSSTDKDIIVKDNPGDELITDTRGWRGWLNTFASLRNRNFRLFAIGMLISFTALQMQMLAQNYLVYQLSGLATAIGYVSAASGISMLVLSFFGGIIADRVSKRNLLALSQLGIAVLTLFLAIMITMGFIEVWHIVVTAIAIGIIAAFNMPARQSYVPDIVGSNDLMNAMALNAGLMNMTRIAGPAIAGVLIGIFGVGLVYFLKTAGYVTFVVILLFIPIKGKSTATFSKSLLGDAAEGLRYLRRDRRVLDLLILSIVPVVLGMPYINFLPVFQEEVFHVGPSELGLMMATVGGGAIVGALVIASLSNHRYKGLILICSGLGFGVTLILFAAVSNTGSLLLSLIILPLVGATSTAYMALNNALMMNITPPEMRGRVMGLFVTTFGLMPLGALPMGALTDVIGAPFTVGISGAAILVFVIIMVIFRPGLKQL